jgi:hypothetical protein
MRHLISALLIASALCLPAHAGSDASTVWAAPPACAASSGGATAAKAPTVQLAQSSCRGNCSSRRGYCMSTCRDRQCRAICNDLYQSCLASCR